MKTSSEPSIRGLLTAQVLGAFNDNAFKLIAALLAIRGVEAMTAPGLERELAAQGETTLAFVIFTLPLMLVSLPAAAWVDRVSKRTILVAMKALEVLLMGCGTLALWQEPSGGPLTLVVLALMGAQSAVFSPAKYGILPEILSPGRLIRGNGILETWTMVAIIAGTASAGHLLDVTSTLGNGAGDPIWMVGLALMSLSVVGFLSIRRLPAVPPAAQATPLRVVMAESWRALRSDRVLWLAAAGSICFWGIASLVSQNALIYGKSRLELSVVWAPLPLAASGVGIAIGAVLVSRLSRGRVELGWIPLGTLGIALATAVIGLVGPQFHGLVVWMVAIGVFSGWVIVPLNTLIQLHAPATRRGAVIAFVNAAQFGGILAGTLSCGLLADVKVDSAGVFAAAALVTLIGTVWAVWLLPQAGVRLFLVLLTQTIYRLRVRGAAHVPAEGGALLVCNHESFVDGLLLSASIDRPIRFLVDKSYYEKPYLRWFMRLFGFVPIAQDAPPRELLESIRRAGEALDEGELVCIFAEGEITRTGQMLPFRRGFSRITKGRDAPVIPVHLDRVWGSLTSFGRDGLLGVLRDLPRKIAVSFGAPEPANVGAQVLQAKIRGLSSEAWCDRVEDAGPLHLEFVRNARCAPWRFAAADDRTARVSRFKLLSSTVALARALRGRWADQTHVGIMLPPSIAGAAVNVAASLAGKTSVNLNFTTGESALAAAVKRADLRTVVTSRAFLDKAELTVPAGIEPIFVEELVGTIDTAAKLGAAVAAALLPVSWLERFCGAHETVEPTDAATVIFSSGSTGDPKGVGPDPLQHQLERQGRWPSPCRSVPATPCSARCRCSTRLARSRCGSRCVMVSRPCSARTPSMRRRSASG